MSYFSYLFAFLTAFGLSFILTIIVRRLAIRFKIFDLPSPRKVHGLPVPRLGGVAFFVAFFILTLLWLIYKPEIIRFSHFIWFNFIDKRLFGVLLGALVLLVVGIIDDVKGLSPLTKLFWQFVAAGIVVASGIGIDVIRNPLGGPLIYLDQYKIPIYLWGHTYQFVVLADIFVILWIVAMINIINFLDGLDGLAAGVGLIAAITLFFLSLRPEVNQAGTALLCLLLAGGLAGFLPANFYPAKIFMGDSGSMFLGYILAVMAVISGGKVTTAFLVLGFPILDAVWVIARRVSYGRSPFLADKHHLHHRFLAAGLTQRQTVLIIYFLSALFGVIALISGTREKFFALLWLLGLMVVLAIILVMIEYKKSKNQK